MWEGKCYKSKITSVPYPLVIREVLQKQNRLGTIPTYKGKGKERGKGKREVLQKQNHLSTIPTCKFWWNGKSLRRHSILMLKRIENQVQKNAFHWEKLLECANRNTCSIDWKALAAFVSFSLRDGCLWQSFVGSGREGTPFLPNNVMLPQQDPTWLVCIRI